MTGASREWSLPLMRCGQVLHRRLQWLLCQHHQVMPCAANRGNKHGSAETNMHGKQPC